jgi:uncharacterized lipoprotein YbaY
VSPLPDEHGKTLLTFTITDGTNSVVRTALLNVISVNDQPSFLLATDTVSWPATGGGHTNIVIAYDDVGAINEGAQLLNYTVVNDNPGLFRIPPKIQRDGNLTFVPKGGAIVGTANLTVSVRDTGGGVNAYFGPTNMVINITP